MDLRRAYLMYRGDFILAETSRGSRAWPNLPPRADRASSNRDWNGLADHPLPVGRVCYHDLVRPFAALNSQIFLLHH